MGPEDYYRDSEDVGFEPSTPRAWWTKAMHAEHAKCPELCRGGFIGETCDAWKFCHCNTPERVVSLMLEYMESRADLPPDTGMVGQAYQEWNAAWKKRHPIDGTDNEMWCAYLADAAGWTEHGGSLPYAWPTPAGLAWLEDARTWKRVTVEEP
jgi:hypothetical protein